MPISVRVAASSLSASVSIAGGSSLSGSVDFGPYGEMATHLFTSGSWDSASISFQVSYDGVTWNSLYDDSNTEVTMTGSDSRCYTLTSAEWYGVRYAKVRSGVAGIVVDQSASRVLRFLITR